MAALIADSTRKSFFLRVARAYNPHCGLCLMKNERARANPLAQCISRCRCEKSMSMAGGMRARARFAFCLCAENIGYRTCARCSLGYSSVEPLQLRFICCFLRPPRGSFGTVKQKFFGENVF